MKSLVTPVLFVLDADQTINTSVVPVLLTGFTMAVKANVPYRVRAWIPFTPANTAMGYRYQLNGPAMTNWIISVWVAGISDGPDLELHEVDVAVPTTATEATVGAATEHIAIMEGTFIPSADGNLTLSHAQGTSNGSNLTTHQGTYMEVTPMV